MNIVSKVGLWAKRHSPELLIGGSIVSLVSSLILTGVATTKVKKVVEPTKYKLKDIRENLKSIPDNAENKEQLSKDLKKEMTLTYAKAAGKILLVYSPAILTAALSITCLLSSHHIMKTRNLALASAYTILDNGFRAYRERVKEKVGEDAEEKIFKNIKKEKVEYTDENGKKKQHLLIKNNTDKKKILLSCMTLTAIIGRKVLQIILNI